MWIKVVEELLNDVGKRFLSDEARRRLTERLADTTHTSGWSDGGISAGLRQLIGDRYEYRIAEHAKFLVERADQEIRIAFVERFRSWACVRPDLESVFSSTCVILEAEELLIRQAILQDLHRALREDLRATPQTVPLAVVRGDAFPNFTPRQKDAVLAGRFVGSFVHLVLDGSFRCRP